MVVTRGRTEEDEMAIAVHVENTNGPTAISENPRDKMRFKMRFKMFHAKMYPATTEEAPVLGKGGNADETKVGKVVAPTLSSDIH